MDWISVKDRLPQVDGPVLIYRKPPSPFETTNNSSRFLVAYFLTRKGIFVSSDGANGYDPTHWAIPEPPKEDLNGTQPR
jgi:hypothetical protein